jgi:eukaryotic-like serine/threonine-protein kinase
MRASQVPTLHQSSAGPARATGAPRESPLVLGRYRLQRRLGAGAFGTVWQAHDERLDREVAVKIVPRERVIGGRFEREARAAARLAHPGIVTLYEAGADDDGAYLVSELVRGSTLDALLADGRLSDQDIVAIGIALCDALAHAHAQNVIHRDVKPSNVLVPERPATPAHPAKLTDFGVARVIGGDSLTRTGDVIGTAAYMAPEQAEGLEAGAPADLYALALVLYEALTGVNPVRAGTAAQRARRLGAHLPPIRRQRRDLPRELGRGLDLALRPKPRERGTVEELRTALQASLPAVGDEPGIVTGGWSAPQHDERPPEVLFAAPAADLDERDAPIEPNAPLLPAWPQRALAATAGAALTFWLLANLLAPSPIAPAVGALLSGAVMLALPRLGWGAAAIGLLIVALTQGRAGAALVLGLAALVPVFALPLAGVAWPLSAGAPALGALGLGGAWPALAARAATPWRRAALGLTGWVWLALAAPLGGTGLYLAKLPGTPDPTVWTSSLYDTVHHVLAPLLSSGALAPAPLWALGAVTLPLLVKRRSFPLDAVRVVVWAAVLVSATTAVLGSIHAPRTLTTPSTAVLGAVAGAVAALAPGALAAWRSQRGPSARLVP